MESGGQARYRRLGQMEPRSRAVGPLRLSLALVFKERSCFHVPPTRSRLSSPPPAFDSALMSSPRNSYHRRSTAPTLESGTSNSPPPVATRRPATPAGGAAASAGWGLGESEAPPAPPQKGLEPGISVASPDWVRDRPDHYGGPRCPQSNENRPQEPQNRIVEHRDFATNALPSVRIFVVRRRSSAPRVVSYRSTAFCSTASAM